MNGILLLMLLIEKKALLPPTVYNLLIIRFCRYTTSNILGLQTGKYGSHIIQNQCVALFRITRKTLTKLLHGYIDRNNPIRINRI
ncbi:hypothetical protein D3C73_825100 [compost metagenome]